MMGAPDWDEYREQVADFSLGELLNALVREAQLRYKAEEKLEGIGGDDHACRWSQEFAILARDNHRTERQKRASDARNRRMAKNCSDRLPDAQNGSQGVCGLDDGRPCVAQCGDDGVIVVDGALVRGRRS